MSSEVSDSAVAKSSQSKTSFVWSYFVKTEDGSRVICQVSLKDGTLCKKHLARDQSSSTKSMIQHLKSHHGIGDPALQGKHTNIKAYFEGRSLEPKVCADHDS